jgi:glucokinase
MNYKDDKRVVLTLDAGGTNFVFSAIQGNEEIIEPVIFPSNSHKLDLCLNTIINGFNEIAGKLNIKPSAISFAFPGPADYPRGIIGDLGNLPAFRGGIALGPMLERVFSLPVFINNDGDLFTYGEAIAGFLPYINRLLKESGSPKQYKNLLGVTLGTGFGGGIVTNDNLFHGDNSGAGEIWLLRNKLNPFTNAEEGACIRGVQRAYAKTAGIAPDSVSSPKEIYGIAKGTVPGNQKAALEAYRQLGESVGDSLAQAITLIDGLIVIGGGISGAADLFMSALLNEMNGFYQNPAGKFFPRLAVKTFNLEDGAELDKFIKGEKKEIPIPFSSGSIAYDPLQRTGVGISKLGTSKAVAIGAYSYALSKIDSK